MIFMFENILADLMPILDDPETVDVQFGFQKHAKDIANYILKSDVTPFGIAIHGEWGSGKTTLLKQINKELTGSENPPKTILFEAWKYEKIDIFSALLIQIKNKFGAGDSFLTAIGVIVADMILHKAFDMSIKNITGQLEMLNKELKTLEDEMEKTVNEKLVILIDDLDRCDPKNILGMLENIKSFLRIKNIIVIMMADMDKIDSAWQLQYNKPSKNLVGRDYTEKIFQMNLTIPNKEEIDLTQYVQKLTSSFGDENIRYLIKNMPSNPRKIKRALNTLHFALSNAPAHMVHGNVNEKNFLHTAITWIAIVSNHKVIAEISKNTPSYLIYAAYACSRFESLTDYQMVVNGSTFGANTAFVDSSKNNEPIILADYMKPALAKILELIATTELPAFKILKHYGKFFEFGTKSNENYYVCEKYKLLFDPYYRMLHYMIHNVLI